MNGSSQTVSRDKLWSYDAGQHTCTVADEDGNIGRATMEMNIIGTCIPVRIIKYKMDQAVATWEYHFNIILGYITYIIDGYVHVWQMYLLGLNGIRVQLYHAKYITLLRTVLSLMPILANRSVTL